MSLHGFEPIIAKHPRLLILGSMPSVTSLEKQEYYGYRHNRFWPMMAEYFHVDLPDYEAKKRCIRDHDIILWDVIGNCDRIGSLDSAIRNEVCNDIPGLLKKYPEISLILCNGKKSFTLFERMMANQTAVEYVYCPSTSNANRTMKEADLFAHWFAQLDRIYQDEGFRGGKG